ncbi:MAG: STAS-like domain-containing protein [Rhodanobacteraceae bacterium]
MKPPRCYATCSDRFEFLLPWTCLDAQFLGVEVIDVDELRDRAFRRHDPERSLNFTGVTTIGPAFADEIFRVFALQHPEVEIAAVHAVPEVQQMIRRAEVARDRQERDVPGS